MTLTSALIRRLTLRTEDKAAASDSGDAKDKDAAVGKGDSGDGAEKKQSGEDAADSKDAEEAGDEGRQGRRLEGGECRRYY